MLLNFNCQGGNLQNVLANVPSVNVDADGSVSAGTQTLSF